WEATAGFFRRVCAPERHLLVDCFRFSLSGSTGKAAKRPGKLRRHSHTHRQTSPRQPQGHPAASALAAPKDSLSGTLPPKGESIFIEGRLHRLRIDFSKFSPF